MSRDIPTRQSNPFSTCWLGPSGTPYVATDGNTPAVLASRLARQQWRGQIVGPHGVGKSTLLRALQPEVAKLGRRWTQIVVHRDDARKPSWRLLPDELNTNSLLVIDGYEQLNPLERLHAGWQCWCSGAGLLVTTHRPFHLPTLLQVSPDETAALAVFERITVGANTPVTKDDVPRAFNACNRDMRQMFDRLYDLHERRNRTARVANNRREHRVTNCEQAVM